MFWFWFFRFNKSLLNPIWKEVLSVKYTIDFTSYSYLLRNKSWHLCALNPIIIFGCLSPWTGKKSIPNAPIAIAILTDYKWTNGAALVSLPVLFSLCHVSCYYVRESGAEPKRPFHFTSKIMSILLEKNCE